MVVYVLMLTLSQIPFIDLKLKFIFLYRYVLKKKATDMTIIMSPNEPGEAFLSNDSVLDKITIYQQMDTEELTTSCNA